jgi:tetratricopeptide (TPR) repeat protein
MKPGRNDPCPCGSGKKHKKCCGQGSDAASPQAALNAAANPSRTLYPRAHTLTPELIGQFVGLLNTGRSSEAERKARELLVQHPNSGILWKALGVSLRNQGKDSLQACARAAALLPDDFEVHSNLGTTLLDIGRADEAVASFRRSLAIKPDYADAHSNLGNALRILGRLEDSVKSCRQAIEIKPDFAGAHCNLGIALKELGQFEDAVTSCRRALEISPNLAEAHNNLGNSLRDLGRSRLNEAVLSYRNAIELKPRFAEAHNNLGIVLRLQGRMADAEASCRLALEINPMLGAAVASLGELQADAGQFSAAEDLFRRAISIEPRLHQAWAAIPRLRKMTAEDGVWQAEAERILAQPLPPRHEIDLRFAIGKYFDDVGEFEKAFIAYERANEIMKGRRAPFDRQQMTRSVDTIIDLYDREWIGRAQRNSNAAARPVLIVGMPRSGTTLVEQILASHPSVYGAGELSFWHDASAAFESSVHHGDPGTGILPLAEDYLRLLEGLSPDSLRVLDKMPSNFRHLGLIHAALPNARIIHLQRNPIDTCLSIYFQHFELAHSYANDLEDLAHYYGQYVRIMQHWRSALPGDAILDLSYEALIEDQEASCRELLDFVGLPWDPRCIEFYRYGSAVTTTASKWQVRQKIGTSSVGRWRNYERFIAPLLALKLTCANCDAAIDNTAKASGC